MSSQIKYKVGDRTFVLDKKSIVRSYEKYCQMSDEDFLADLINIMHFAVYVCYIKNIPSKDILSDDGLIHELVHLMQDNTRKFVDLKKIRKNFNKTLCVKKEIITFPKIN